MLYSLVKYSIDTPENGKRKGKVVLKNKHAHQILTYLFKGETLVNGVYEITHEVEKNILIALTIGKYQWQIDKERIADAYIKLQKNATALNDLTKTS